MFWKRLVFAGYFALVVLLVLHVPCSAKRTYLCENPSSCGTLINLAYPFRFKDDPPGCGDSNYELVCENNQPILNLYSGKYYVKAINYNNSTIRVVDVGVQDENCSSLPLFTLNYFNFSSQDPYEPSYISEDVMFVSCESPVESADYVDTAPCVNGNHYRYALVGIMAASALEDLCTIDLMSRTSPRGQFSIRNLSYADVHKGLAVGFELSWFPIRCEECRGQGHCSFDNTTNVVRCSQPSLLLAAKFLCGAPIVFIFLIYKWRRRHLSMFDSVEEFLQSHNNLMPIRYSYSQIRKMTNNFKDKLGEGGYGSVYKGKLRSGNLVAVKMLGKSKANGQDFINEVATIGRIHHVNVVRLIGFCVERSKRALIYDFMPNRSLDKYIISQENSLSLSWEKVHEISLGVARGIEYLHRGCDMQILHFDIKPHNILLDGNFTPKISDFGLAKLYPANDIIVSLTAVRGTIGYIAPELFYKNIGGVSYKADVYSFGMLLMEIAGKRKNNPVTENSSQTYFPFSVYDQVLDGKERGIEDATEDEKKIVKKMVMVALWCIQVNPIDRPPMHEVVRMLEGELESIQMPPKLFMFPEETLVNDAGDDTNPNCSSSASVWDL
ncbi:rust resistance kinase Lr10-like [Hevea brasiliensis]|uniref:rust resistance kinase Lr10-like n=1 Tax=Hevea brasiliensis TaxID=3981 RepID=UPI0025E42AD9|nr:rust resistance kinase Lr10-like [Hevea brasiliensis]